MQTPEAISRALITYLQTLSDEQWQIKVTDKWTVADVFAHLVGWLEEVVNILPQSWHSKELPWFVTTDDYADFNQKQIDRYRHYSHKELIGKYTELNSQLDTIIDQIGIENLRADKNFSWALDEGEDNHELYHLNQIRNAVEAKSN